MPQGLNVFASAQAATAVTTANEQHALCSLASVSSTNVGERLWLHGFAVCSLAADQTGFSLQLLEGIGLAGSQLLGVTTPVPTDAADGDIPCSIDVIVALEDVAGDSFTLAGVLNGASDVAAMFAGVLVATVF